ncbi:Pycsar system effector family protein [Salinisphaera sp. SPP-AMP-43]|uniref:Pycsar system effector family protein n=1 Tax=Salinisphaera sp. SPP-AMP-43 TaxID=3121288 RepID=UPI003C6DCEA9
MKRDERRQFLENMLDRVIKWLEYAERKNAVLLTFVGTLTVLLLRVESTQEFCGFSAFLIFAALFGFVLSSLIVLISFAPQLDPTRGFMSRKIASELKASRTQDLLYFGYVAQISTEKYRDQLHEFFALEDEFSTIELELINQVSINSSIVDKKFLLFDASVRIAGFAALAGIVGVILN